MTVDYIVLVAPDAQRLADQVKQYLPAWRPLGRPFEAEVKLNSASVVPRLHQALVRESEG